MVALRASQNLWEGRTRYRDIWGLPRDAPDAGEECGGPSGGWFLAVGQEGGWKSFIRDFGSLALCVTSLCVCVSSPSYRWPRSFACRCGSAAVCVCVCVCVCVGPVEPVGPERYGPLLVSILKWGIYICIYIYMLPSRLCAALQLTSTI